MPIYNKFISKGKIYVNKTKWMNEYEHEAKINNPLQIAHYCYMLKTFGWGVQKKIMVHDEKRVKSIITSGEKITTYIELL